ncbi:hypothetical protein JCM11491_005124 [Sporobolomyces phaffii]
MSYATLGSALNPFEPRSSSSSSEAGSSFSWRSFLGTRAPARANPSASTSSAQAHVQASPLDTPLASHPTPTPAPSGSSLRIDRTPSYYSASEPPPPYVERSGPKKEDVRNRRSRTKAKEDKKGTVARKKLDSTVTRSTSQSGAERDGVSNNMDTKLSRLQDRVRALDRRMSDDLRSLGL